MEKKLLPAGSQLESSSLQIENYNGNFKKFLVEFGKLNRDLSIISKERESELTQAELAKKEQMEIDFCSQLKTFEMLEKMNQVIVSGYQEKFKTVGNISANLYDTVDYFESSKSVVKIVKDGNKVVGVFLGKIIETKLNFETVELAGFLLPDYQQKGIGTKILKKIIVEFSKARYFVATTPNPAFIKSVDNLLTRIVPEVDHNERLFVASSDGLEVVPQDPKFTLKDLSLQKLELTHKLTENENWHEEIGETLLSNAVVPGFFQDFYSTKNSQIPGLKQNDAMICVWRNKGNSI